MNKAASIIKGWRESPEKFAWDNFKFKADPWQKRAMELFPSQKPDELRIALQACVGPGKSALLAVLGWNFLSCYGGVGDHPKGAAVSVTADNLKDNLWPEFYKWQERSEFLKAQFEWTKERIHAKQFPEDWFLSARSFSKKANAEEQGRTLSGLHSKFVLALIDESGDIPPAVAKAAEQAMSTNLGENSFKKLVQAGNPTSLEGILYSASVDAAHLWKVIRITGDPDDPERSSRIDIEWAREQIKTWGRDNPWVMSAILGLFPPASINALIGPDEVEEAFKRHLTDDMFSWAQKRMGIDAARFGDDPWVLARRQGLASFPMILMRNPRTPDVAARAANEAGKWQREKGGGAVRFFVDGTGGYGAGCIDALLQAEYQVNEVQFGGKPIDPRFQDKRSEMIWETVEWIKRGGVLAPNPMLKKQLVKSTYTFKNGKLWVVPKDQYKKDNAGQSTDELDALACTFAEPDQADDLGGRITQRQRQEYAHPQKPYDIFGDLEGNVSGSYGDDVREAGKY